MKIDNIKVKSLSGEWFLEKSYYCWIVWGVAAFFFFCEYFARVSPGVMAQELMRDLAISGLGLGSLSAFFYYPYLAMQLPVGLLVDRFGVRRLLSTMAVLTGLSCIVFSQAHGLGLAKLGRFLLGFSASFAFVGALKLASVWFPAQRFGLLAALTQTMGMLGAVVGEAPVSYLVDSIGWRQTMMVMAVAFIVLAGVIAMVVRDQQKGAKAANGAHHEHDAMTLWQSLLKVMSNPQSWWNCLYAGLVFAPTAAFAELWGVTYLMDARGLSHSAAAWAVGMIFIGWGLGGPFMGWLSDRIGKRRPLMWFSASAGAITMGALFFIPHLSTAFIYVLMLVYGATNAGVAISYAVASEINPRPVAGTSIAFANLASVIIGAGFQPVIGLLLDLQATPVLHNNLPVYPPEVFVLAMAMLPICSLLAVFVTFLVKETHCRAVGNNH